MQMISRKRNCNEIGKLTDSIKLAMNDKRKDIKIVTLLFA